MAVRKTTGSGKVDGVILGGKYDLILTRLSTPAERVDVLRINRLKHHNVPVSLQSGSLAEAGPQTAPLFASASVSSESKLVQIL